MTSQYASYGCDTVNDTSLPSIRVWTLEVVSLVAIRYHTPDKRLLFMINSSVKIMYLVYPGGWLNTRKEHYGPVCVGSGSTGHR